MDGWARRINPSISIIIAIIWFKSAIGRGGGSVLSGDSGGSGGVGDVKIMNVVVVVVVLLVLILVNTHLFFSTCIGIGRGRRREGKRNRYPQCCYR